MLKSPIALLLLSALAGAGSMADASAAGTVAHRPVQSASGLSLPRPGAGKSRMPLTTLDAMPLASGIAGAVPRGVAGRSSRAIRPMAVGTDQDMWPYSIARVANGSPQASTAIEDSPASAVPYRQTGKLIMRYGDLQYVCSASLIKRGVLITAAHCVQDFGRGEKGSADEVVWYPAHSSASGGPFGSFTATEWRVPDVYANGTDTCWKLAHGVACNNDIATVVLAPRNGKQAGTLLGGWYDYGWNGAYFVTSPGFGDQSIAAVTQLGYPVALDSGLQMQRNTSFAKYDEKTATNNNKTLLNALLGSAMSGGSSGGPWLANFGTRPTVVNDDLGSASEENVVVAVTSWGYGTSDVNVLGASWFGQNAEYPRPRYGRYGAGNIGALMQDTCVANPTAC